jgi:plasmid stabilization system protein ParE
MYSSSNHLLAAAMRVLRACARGGSPKFSDVRFLNRHTLLCQTRMHPAEVAGITIWRVRHGAQTMQSAA